MIKEVNSSLKLPDKLRQFTSAKEIHKTVTLFAGANANFNTRTRKNESGRDIDPGELVEDQQCRNDVM